MAGQEIEHLLTRRLERDPQLEAASIQAVLDDGSYIADILPKFRERLILLNRIHVYSSPEKAGIAQFPSVERVSPITSQNGDIVGLVGMRLKKVEALVVEVLDPDSEIELSYEYVGIKHTLLSNSGPVKSYRRSMIYDRLRRHHPEQLLVKITPVNKAK